MQIVTAGAAVPPALIFEFTETVVQRVAVGRHDAALSGGDRLVGRERETACEPERANPASGVTRTQSLGGVADQHQTLGAADRLQPSIVRAAAIDVDGDNRPRARPNRSPDAVRIDAEAERLDVYQL